METPGAIQIQMATTPIPISMTTPLPVHMTSATPIQSQGPMSPFQQYNVVEFAPPTGSSTRRKRSIAMARRYSMNVNPDCVHDFKFIIDNERHPCLSVLGFPLCIGFLVVFAIIHIFVGPLMLYRAINIANLNVATIEYSNITCVISDIITDDCNDCDDIGTNLSTSDCVNNSLLYYKYKFGSIIDECSDNVTLYYSPNCDWSETHINRSWFIGDRYYCDVDCGNNFYFNFDRINSGDSEGRHYHFKVWYGTLATVSIYGAIICGIIIGVARVKEDADNGYYNPNTGAARCRVWPSVPMIVIVCIIGVGFVVSTFLVIIGIGNHKF